MALRLATSTVGTQAADNDAALVRIMSRLDHDIHTCRALVIDGNPTSRSVLTAQLRDFGVGTVVQTGRVKEARTILENRHFDVVLCDYHFEGSDMNATTTVPAPPSSLAIDLLLTH